MALHREIARLTTRLKNDFNQRNQMSLDMMQLDDKLKWMTSQMTSKEHAYRLIKKNLQPWILKMRVVKLVQSGRIKQLKLSLNIRDSHESNAILLMTSFANQLNVLYSVYLEPLLPLVAEKAFSAVDPKGFNLQVYQEFTNAAQKLMVLQRQISLQVNVLLALARSE